MVGRRRRPVGVISLGDISRFGGLIYTKSREYDATTLHVVRKRA